jgi:hypothetical protein
MAAKKNAGQSVEETREQEKAVEEAAAEERVPQEYYEVRVNPRLNLGARDRVSLGGKMFYADDARNRTEGTWLVDDIQWESLGQIKNPDSGLKYLVRVRTVGSDTEDEGGEG